MEKGSFQPSRPPVHASQIDEKVKSIPIPTQLPKSLDISDIPPAALRSATIETLISQNEDLMARLSVALRKTNDLEQKVADLEEERKSLRSRFETLKDQFLVLKEKDRSATQRVLEQHDENINLKHQAHKLEHLYKDLYQQAEGLKNRVARLERYRARLKKALPPIHARAKAANRLEREIVTIKTDLSIKHMQSINGYEAKLNEARAEIENLKPKALERDKIYEELMQVQNDAIFNERQFEQIRRELTESVEQLQSENASLRTEIKELLVDRESKIQELTRLNNEVPHLQSRNQALVEQVESLQALWNHKEQEYQQLAQKNQALQKLNQSLSVSMNQQRKELHALKTELDKEKITAQEKIKTLLAEIQMLRGQASPEPKL